MIYCIEVKRGGIGEEDFIIHHKFENEPNNEDILKIIEDEDCGYDSNYCEFDYWRVD